MGFKIEVLFYTYESQNLKFKWKYYLKMYFQLTQFVKNEQD